MLRYKIRLLVNVPNESQNVMQHLNKLQELESSVSKSFIESATGKFYTHETVANHLINALLQWARGKFVAGDKLRLIDPFVGDGRLLQWLVLAWRRSSLPKVTWEIVGWDLDNEGLSTAQSCLEDLSIESDVISIEIQTGDAFRLATHFNGVFDIVITNPPWEMLKPDKRELALFDEETRAQYIDSMRDYDAYLEQQYPSSQPLKKFAGWGTNLSRVGSELADNLCKPNGVIGLVLPASILADQQSINIRKRLLTERALFDVAYFPAEARLFGKADVESVTALFCPNLDVGISPNFTRYDANLFSLGGQQISLHQKFLEHSGYVIPASMGGAAIDLFQRLGENFHTFSSLEGKSDKALWAGREIDETGSQTWLAHQGSAPLFIKGKNIGRFSITEEPKHRVMKRNWKAPVSTDFERIVWRDVSRPNQKRRLIATVIPIDWVAGNSLGVAYFRDGNLAALLTLLGVMSSLVFEFQLRGYLATGHVSLSSLRRVRVPSRKVMESCSSLLNCVNELLDGNSRAGPTLEAIVAKHLYGLTASELETVLSQFPKLDSEEKIEIMQKFEELQS